MPPRSRRARPIGVRWCLADLTSSVVDRLDRALDMPFRNTTRQRISKWFAKPRIMKMRSFGSVVATGIEALCDAAFDRWHRLDFGGVIEQADLATNQHPSHANAFSYEAAAGIDLRIVVSEALRVDPTFQNFLDLGSGKGKSCNYVAWSFGFKNIVGIEFSAQLIEIAEINNKKLNTKNVTYILADAARYKIAPAPTIVYMYNPFDASILENFLSNNMEHFRTHGSVIAYVNDRHRSSLTKFGFETVYRDQTRKHSIYRLPDPAGGS